MASRARMTPVGLNREPTNAIEAAKLVATATADITAVMAQFEPNTQGYAKALYDDQVAEYTGLPLGTTYAVLHYLTQVGYLDQRPVQGHGTYYRRALAS
jgi:hypothetical protein